MTIDTLTEFLGWASVINIGILLLSTVLVILMRGWISRLHGSLFGLNEADLGRAYFQYIAQYKIAIIILNIVPYISLKVIS